MPCPRSIWRSTTTVVPAFPAVGLVGPLEGFQLFSEPGPGRRRTRKRASQSVRRKASPSPSQRTPVWRQRSSPDISDFHGVFLFRQVIIERAGGNKRYSIAKRTKETVGTAAAENDGACIKGILERTKSSPLHGPFGA